MSIPKRLRRQQGRHALVDGIPFQLPVNSEQSPALMVGFTIDADRAAALLPGSELHPFRLWGNKGVLLVTVIDYRVTDIGKYVEFSIAIACTHGRRPAPALVPALFRKTFGVGQYVYDLPVSTEVSVKGGKGIWGMPKHQAQLDFLIEDDRVSSQYDLDGQLVLRVEIERPERTWLPVSAGAVNYCQFRGMLMASYIYFKSKAGLTLRRRGAGRLTFGDHPRIQPIRNLGVSEDPLFTLYLPASQGVLDDHFECWFLHYDTPPLAPPEGLESVVHLGRDETWLAPPDRSHDVHPRAARV